MASELESDLQDPVEWGMLIVDFNAGKAQLALFDCSHNCGSIDRETDGYVLDGNLSKVLGLSVSSRKDWGCYIISIDKIASKKIAALYKSTIWLCMEYHCHVWAGTPYCFLYILDNLQS